MPSSQGSLEDFPKLAPLPVEPEEDEVADDLKVSSCIAFLLNTWLALITTHIQLRSRPQRAENPADLV